MPLEIRGVHFLIRTAQLVRGTRLEWALGEAPADKRFGADWSQLWWQQFLTIFLRTNVIFCT